MKALLAAFLLTALPAHADEVLARMAGTWRGAGSARASADAAPEAARCRLDARWRAGEGRLLIEGRCAVAGGGFQLTGALIADGADGLRGRWANPEGPGSALIVGTRGATSARFEVNDRRVTWTLGDDGLRLDAEDATTGAVLAGITFTR